MKKAFLVTLLLFWASFAVGQRGGIPNFTAADDFPDDTINLITLAPIVHFNLLSKGTGSGITVESPQGCHANGTDTYCGFGTNVLPGFFFVPHELVNFVATGSSASTLGCNYFTATAFQGIDGLTKYPIAATTVYQNSTCGVTTATATTTDGSGITGTFGYVMGGSGNVTSASNTSGWTWTTSTTKIADPFGNSMTATIPAGSFTDMLGASITFGTAAQGYGTPSSYGYTDISGTSQTISLVAGTATTFQPLGSCGSFNGGGSVTPASSISFPDGTSIGLTWDTNSTGIDGLLKSFTNRSGGTTTYTYGTVNCTDNGNWYFSTLSRVTPDGTWSYSTSNNGSVTTTTVLDPGKNKTVYAFFGVDGTATFTNTIDRYQNTGTVASPAYTHISETQYCYNNATCTTAPTATITQLDTYEYTYTPTPTQVQMSHDVKLYDSTYGLVTSDAATDSINSQTITTTYVYGTYSSGTCSAITNTAIHDHPCTITTKNGTTWLSESTYTYNANGALTSSSACLSSTCTGSSALTTTYTPTTQGTYSAIQDPSGQTVNYTYGSCNSLMPTDVTTTVNSIAIDRKATWNCNGGLVTDTTDPNSNEDDYTYDSMNRLHTYHDRMGDTNTTTYDYGTPTLDHVKVTDNIGVVSYQYNDGLGRPLISQIYNGTNYDTVSHTYGWTDSMSHALTNFQTTTSGGTNSAACTAALDTACTTVTLTALTNPIAGPYKTTDANSGTVTFGIGFGSTGADSSVTAGPAPSGEHTKVVQTEGDGFGRIDSVCALENTGGTTCGQALGNSGVLTSNVYSFATGAPKVVTTRGSQSHTVIADAVGRTTSVQTPEAGTITYTYDSATTGNCSTITSKGDLLEISHSGSSIYECYNVDAIHRLTDVGNTTDNSTNPCKRFRYDSTANNIYTKPTSYPASGNNLVGRLMEAATDDCTFPYAQAHMITDEWFAYDKMGRMTDMWEATPNSGGFYHTTVAYDADGVVTSLSGIPSYSSITWGNFDSEDRPTSLKYGTTTIVNSTGFTYDAAGNPTNVPISTGGDADVFTWDNLGHMLTYNFNVGTKHDKGTLTWNSIGSLGKLVIDDTITSSTDSQTCAYGYDDVARLTSEATVSGSTCNGPMTYTYDQYDNLTQAGTFSWNPGYSSTNNTQTGSTYDSDGNNKTDGVNSYTWNAYEKIASARSGNSAAVCGTSGTCYTYDAFGNVVEYNVSGSTHQYLYGPLGLSAYLNGQTPVWAMLPAPGSGKLWLVGSTPTTYFIHEDWVGTGRMVDTISGTNYNDQAYTAYGQTYDTLGSAFALFAGDIQDQSGDNLYLTPNRNLFQNSGRWLSPDPAHSGWNAYAYVTDPNTQTDPSGLCEANGAGCPADIPGIPFPIDQSQACAADKTKCGDQSGFSGSDSYLTFRNPDTLSSRTFAGGFWGPEGPHGHDYAAAMINSHILSDVFNASSWGEVGHRFWENLKSGGCPNYAATGQICKGEVSPVGGGGWEAPTFEVFQPSEEVLSDIRGFVKEHPEYINAKCGQCGEATGKFLQYGLDRGRYYAWQNVNRGEGGPLFQQITNPMFDYTVVYGREGLVHAVNLSPDGKWVIDMSATQFRNDYPPRWVSYPYIFPVDPNSF